MSDDSDSFDPSGAGCEFIVVMVLIAFFSLFFGAGAISFFLDN